MSDLFVFASHKEAIETLEFFSAKPMSDTLYKSDIGTILICGVGLFDPLFHLNQSEYSSIINLGCAGAMRDDFELFNVVEVSKVSLFLSNNLHDEELKTSLRFMPPIQIQEKGLHLATSTYPIKSSETKQQAHDYDLVDMEGYSIAYFAHKKNIPCKMVKVISDFSNEGSVIGSRLKRVSYELCKVLKKTLFQKDSLL